MSFWCDHFRATYFVADRFRHRFGFLTVQLFSAPIPCSLTVQLFRVSQKAPNIGAKKVRAEMVALKSCRPPFNQQKLSAKYAI